MLCIELGQEIELGWIFDKNFLATDHPEADA
jgi:hypothetical protein